MLKENAYFERKKKERNHKKLFLSCLEGLVPRSSMGLYETLTTRCAEGAEVEEKEKVDCKCLFVERKIELIMILNAMYCVTTTYTI